MFRPSPAIPSRFRLLWLPMICWIFLAVLTDRLLTFARDSTPFETVLAAAEPGQRALAAVFDSSPSGTDRDFSYTHLPAW